VVLLLSLPTSHQRVGSEVDLKYGDRDITSSSIVFCCSKDNGANGKPLPESIYKPKLICYQCKLKTKEQKCLPVSDERCVHSRELFPATIPPQEVCDSTERFLIPQELIRLRGLKKMTK
jgi:hypothetical protein